MKRGLRRIGGVKRLFFGILAFLAVFYVAQTFISSDGSKPDSLSASPKENVSIGSGKVTDKNEPVVSDGSKFENKAASCDVDAVCPSSTLVFTVRPFRKNDDEQNRPQFCVNGKIISSVPVAPKTISVVVVSGSTRVVEEMKHFDVSVDDKELRDFLIRLPHSSLIFVSSAGNVKSRLTEDTRSVLRTQFGAHNDTGSAAASLLFVGQKGLKSGNAMEKKEDAPASGTSLVLRGCLHVPMGDLERPPAAHDPSTASPLKKGQVVHRDSIAFGSVVEDCGMEKPCQPNDVSVSVYSGKNKDEEPKICVNGRMMMSRTLNKGGRGLNAVILNATTKEVLRVGHFDTYAEDSSSLEVFVEEMVIGEMIIVVSFDEASNHFSSVLKQMFYELGSALVQNLKFRSSWFIIGQKGITGFSPFEELNFASGNDWAKSVDRRMCVPPFLDGLRVRPDPIVRSRNVAKRRFCEKYDGYEEFCEDGHLDDPITAAPLVNRSMNGNPIYKVPIMVVSGLSHNSLRLCLETLTRQPGIDPNLVMVTYDENYAESGELAQLFHFKYKAVTSSASYITQMAKSFEVLWEAYTDSDVAIVIEEELMVTADFLYFMAQMLPILRNDNKLHAVSAWNINGYTDTATLPNTVYRVEDFPGLAFMIRKSTYTKYMKGKMDVCCGRRAWEGWNLELADRLPQMIVPDLSRVMRRHVDGLGGIIDQTLEDIFHRGRAYSKSADTWITNSKAASSQDYYDSALRALIESSTLLDVNAVLKECSKLSPSLLLSYSKDSNSFVLQYEESKKMTPQLERLIRHLRRCFGLYYSTNSGKESRANGTDISSDGSPSKFANSPAHSWTRRGVYKGVIQFSYGGLQLLLVGSRSPFYSQRRATAAVGGRQNVRR